MNLCPICPALYRPVNGHGDKPAKYMIIGERPGKQENARGVPFTGDSGEELDQTYLPLAGIDRGDCRVDNTVRCWAENNKKPTDKEIAACSVNHLPIELEETRPEVVFLLGATACSLIPDIDLELDHGMMKWRQLFGWQGYVIPMFHPASGMHDTAMMIHMLSDWARVGEDLRFIDKYNGAILDLPVQSRDYRLARTSTQVLEYFSDHSSGLHLLGGDSERHDNQPYSLQISLKPRTAVMVMETDESAMGQLARCLGQGINGHNPEFVFHQAEADLGPFKRQLRKLAWCNLDRFKYRDTQMECYHFGDHYKQGLKPLAFRTLGRRRLSWQEVVGPPSRDRLCEWLMDAMVIVERDWRVVVEQFSQKTGKRIKDKVIVHPLESILKRVRRHTLDGGDYDPWERLDEQSIVLGPLVELIGPVPRMGIAHASLKDQIDYACSDPDDTLCLALEFEKRREEIVAVGSEWDIDEGDWDHHGGHNGSHHGGSSCR